MAKEGRFCSKADPQTSEVCNALMNERATLFQCPKCGAVELLTLEEINQKIERERRQARPGQFQSVKHSFATEEGDVIGQA